MMKTDNQSFHYWQCGLDYVYLSGGVELYEHEGETFYKIREVDMLHAALAEKIVTSLSPIRGMELKFLRSFLGMSQDALAKSIGRKRDAIAKAESKIDEKINGQTDRLIRFLILARIKHPEMCQKIIDLLDDITENDYQKELQFLFNDGWELNAKAA